MADASLHKMRTHFLKNFPKAHKRIKPAQLAALAYDEKIQGSTIQELPTGSGKTAKGYANLLGLRERYGEGTYFYITPNKALVDQIKGIYDEFHVIYGRNEYDCYYYEEPKFTADKIPCSLLDDCPFRVDFQTGQTFEPEVVPCPYLYAKWKAKSRLVVCTMSFYLFTTLFGSQWGEIKGVVVDEAHQIVDVIRGALSYEITERHLEGIIDLLGSNQIEGAVQFKAFLKLMKKAVRRHSYKNPLFEDSEIRGFISELSKINRSALEKKVKDALRGRLINEEQREVVKKLEMVIRNLHSYITSFEFCMERDKKRPLNYTYGYLNPKSVAERQAEGYSIHIKCYHAAPVIRRIFPLDRTYFMSATIGDIEAFRMTTGLEHPFKSHESEFPIKNTRIYLPLDIEDLSTQKAALRSKAKTIRRIARTCKLFAAQGHRSLVLVVSEEERAQFQRMAIEEGLVVATYDRGRKSKEVVQMFKRGEGDTLLGTFAQYGEGIDLPNQVAPVTFALKPAYPPPNDPMALFEERRFGNSRWLIWNAREMQRILQARGRNIRSEKDKGVTFCMSRQYKNIVYKSLPGWLRAAYRNTMKFDACVSDALKLLNGK